MMGLEHLSSTEPPWMELLVLPQEKLPRNAVRNFEKLLTVHIEGSACKTKDGLFSVFATALKFPSYFGNNWDAFEECINDLEWLPANGYLLIVFDAKHVLVNTEREYKIFVDIIHKAGSNWATGNNDRGPVPFHLLLVIADKEDAAKRNWCVPIMSLESGERQ
jgi:RNAse (barnase) inhibitor barstar